MNDVGKMNVVHVLDWYDGVVLGIATATWCNGSYATSLLAWSLARRLRAFALLPLAAAEAQEVASIAEWEKSKKYLRSLVARLTGDIEVVVLRDDDEIVGVPRRVHVDHLREDVIGDVEGAIAPARVNKWLPSLE